MAVSSSSTRPGAGTSRRSPAGDEEHARARAPRGESGIARLGRRTKLLTPRLRPGDIAVIDHLDLDRVSGEDLAASGVRAVVNCSASSSGGYPNMGPLVLVQAGVHLVDVPGAPLFDILKDGDAVTIVGGDVMRAGRVLARGDVQDPVRLRAQSEDRRREIGEALAAFAQNTVEHVLEEQELLAGPIDLPRFDTVLRDRPVLIVVRGAHHKEDLRALRSYIRDVKPLLLGVDGGANAICEEGLRPHMIIGDMDSASEPALRAAGELVVHAYPDGKAPGRARLDELGLAYKVVPAPGTSQDVAMLVAAEKGAELIVSVGSQFNLVEFLDKNRRGMSSTFLTRLRVGELLVDAKGVSRLYQPRPGLGPVFGLAAVGLVILMLTVLATPALKDVADLLWLKLQLLLGID